MSDDARALFGKSLAAGAAERLFDRSPGGPRPTEVAARAAPVAKSDFQRVKGELQRRLLDDIGDVDAVDGSAAGEEALRARIVEFCARVLAAEELPLNAAERARLAGELAEEVVGLGPLAPLLADPAITDILVNGPDLVYVERFGRLEPTEVRFRDAEHVVRVIERIAARVGRRIDASSPMVDLRLEDGSRVNATLPPVSIDYPTISIRRFGRRRLARADLVAGGMLSPHMAEFLEHAVRGRCNILISGGTGAGKSTLLSALAEAIGGDERIITIEDTAELQLDQRHVVRLETRPPNAEGRGAIGARDLLVNSLRMRPTRILVGEVRGPEALDLLQALNTGHEGGLSTIHANSPRDALARLETMVLMAGLDLPSRAIREQMVSALDLLIHVERSEDGVRRVAAIAEVAGMEGTTPLLQDVFRFQQRGRQGRRVTGEFAATGIVPRAIEELRAQGTAVPLHLFQKPPDAADG